MRLTRLTTSGRLVARGGAVSGSRSACGSLSSTFSTCRHTGHVLSPNRFNQPEARRKLVPIRAEEDSTRDKSAQEEEDAEARLEAIEASALKKKSPPRRPQDAGSTGGMAEWKEGELFPEGWDDMNVGQKAVEIYMGKRGLLFWLNKVAFGAVIAIGVAWVLFRFVGPQLGLYDLKSALSDIQY